MKKLAISTDQSSMLLLMPLKALLVWLILVLKLEWSQCAINATFQLRNTQRIDGEAIALPSGNIVFILNDFNSLSTKTDEEFPHRIVGGHPITISEAPWQVAILRNGKLECGGSLLNAYWILTAAHCIRNTGNYYVRAGTRLYRTGGQTRHIKIMVKHKSYNSRTMDYDIGMIKVYKPFRLGQRVRPVKLATEKSALPNYFYVSGWGLMDEYALSPARVLRRVQVQRVGNGVCSNDYGRKAVITNRMLCAEGRYKDSCSGDSGGPLYWRGRQYGIVSFGRGCARRFYPGVYTDVRRQHKFINSTMKKYNNGGGSGEENETSEPEDTTEEARNE